MYLKGVNLINHCSVCETGAVEKTSPCSMSIAFYFMSSCTYSVKVYFYFFVAKARDIFPYSLLVSLLISSCYEGVRITG